MGFVSRRLRSIASLRVLGTWRSLAQNLGVTDPESSQVESAGAASEQGTFCALVGPTAVGKTELSLIVAERAGAEIISIDSMLVYRGLDIGTAKPGAEVTARVKHHVIDCADPPERYDARRYLADVCEAETVIAADRKRTLYSGGTGFYLKALTHGLFEGPPANLEQRELLIERAREEGSPVLHEELRAADPKAAERIHPNDERRIVRALEVWLDTGRTLSDWQREWRDEAEEQSAGRPRCLIGLELEPSELDLRIRERTRAMLDAGWVEEARAIRDGVGFGPTSASALGYREVLAFADGELTREELEAEIYLRTRQFARKQRTWYRSYTDIQWIPAPLGEGGALKRTAELILRAFGW